MGFVTFSSLKRFCDVMVGPVLILLLIGSAGPVYSSNEEEKAQLAICRDTLR